MHRELTPLTCLLTIAALAVATSPAAAIVLIDDSFSAAENYVDGLLQFQQPDGAGNGIWLGQKNDTTGNPSVDATAGIVSVVGGSTPAGDAFLRNIWSLGATGSSLGGSNPETGSGFDEGDIIKIDLEYQFDITNAINGNHSFFVTGVRDCFATCGFDATPTAGIKAAYNPFADGTVKLFTNPARAGSNGADNPFALFLDPADIGLDNVGLDSDPLLTVDGLSDNLLFSYEAALTDGSTDTWTATSLTVTNLDTATVIADANAPVEEGGNPMALESFKWNQDVDDPFTEENEGGVAVSTGTDMWVASRWIDATSADVNANSGGIRFEYLPINGGPTLMADFNGDGVVDLLDLDILGQNFGMPGTMATGDANGDGTVDLLDLDILGQEFGMGGSSASVPEPTAVLLAGLSVGLTIVRRTRR